MGEIIKIKESEMNNIQNYLSRVSTNVEEASSKLASSLSSFSNVGLFSSGTGKISDQIDSISRNISSLGRSVGKQFNEMVLNEEVLKNKAESIEIPTDFITDAALGLVEITTGMMSKEDGQKINSNNLSSDKYQEFESTVEFNKNLSKFVKDYEQENGEITVKGKNINLSNIKNNNDTTISEDMEESILIKQVLSDISKELSEKIQDLDFSCDIENIKLSKEVINNLQNVNFDDAYRIVKNEIVRILNNGNYNLVNLE